MTALAALGIGALLAVAVPPALRADEDQPGAPTDGRKVHLIPQARELSSFDFEGRLNVFTRDVSFDVPPDYQEGLEHWIDQMKGVRKVELIQILTLTRDVAEDGTVPFRKQISRYQLEIGKYGRSGSPYGTLEDDVATLAWEGVFDAHGNVAEMHRTKEVENESIKELSFPLLGKLFPRIEGPQELEIGNGFTEVTSLPLPSGLKINGLEGVRIQMTRNYVLEEITANQARFKVQTSYATDPETPSTVPRASCDISGGGPGDAVFDTRLGVFLSAEMKTTLKLDIVAPMRRLPHQPEGFDPGTGKVYVDMYLRMRGKQHVRRVIGTDDG